MVKKRDLSGFVYFVAAVVALALSLRFFGWLPLNLQEGLLHKYHSVEEVSSRLKIRDIYIPSYFPQPFSWPPSEILAQTRPFNAVTMEFRRGTESDTALIISQVASGRRFPTDRTIDIVQTKEKTSYLLKGRKADLEVGLCRNGETCSMISWDEGAYRMTVTMKAGPFDLISLAESMVR